MPEGSVVQASMVCVRIVDLSSGGRGRGARHGTERQIGVADPERVKTRAAGPVKWRLDQWDIWGSGGSAFTHVGDARRGRLA